MEVRAMGLHARERWKLRQIEEALRKDDPGLDTLLAGRPPPRKQAPRRRAPRAMTTWVLAAGVLVAYLVPPALLAAGLALPATWLLVAGGALCPLIPIGAWLLIRRRSRRGEPSHSGKP
jgi:Protein of unknown function (DUF3040)